MNPEQWVSSGRISGCLANRKINSKRSQGNIKYDEQQESLLGHAAASPGTDFSIQKPQGSQSSLASPGVCSRFGKSSRCPSPQATGVCGGKFIQVFGFAKISFLGSPLIFRMEPKVQAKVIKAEASNQVFLTMKLHPSEHRVDGSQHVMTNMGCCCKESRVVIIIKHSSTDRECWSHARLVASLLPSIRTRAQKETQTEKDSVCS